MKEINPMNMKGLTKEKVISNVNIIIKLSYLFMGYIEFSNYIENIKSVKGNFIKTISPRLYFFIFLKLF